ncbi:2-amino-4-hydroxy-6-hydroxymethyldihydropteridine diphosphokinase [Candidatus Aerophobetes bacterium]|nr:2-amino-4-hydroxy-6-hydroxymethyldihydropteridine diphosphokinase [Candidatus Aerophobetes bacterium]
MTYIYIALGTNRGPRLQNIENALKRLGEIFEIEKVSSFYLTEPVGIKGGWFVNCVAKCRTDKSPSSVLKELLQIENKMGRIRGEKEKRTIDLDLLFYGESVIKEDDLVVPHPRIQERRFVLTPLCEIAPELKHPLLGKEVKKILDELKDNLVVEKIER